MAPTSTDRRPRGPTPARARGDAVEALARRHLQAAGLREVAVNANYRCGELDLVMLDASGRTPCLVFVEVRYRRDARFGGGAASVDAHKCRRLVRAAQAFLVAHPAYRDSACRFDVVDAHGDPTAPELRWLRDAFRADEA
jgi:putative endonuclease